MRALPLCFVFVALAASAQRRDGGASAEKSSIVMVQNASVYDPDEQGAPAAALIADAVDSVTIAVAIRDGEGEPIADFPVRIEVTGSRNVVTPAAASLTDANGIFIANLTTTAAEVKTITVVADPGRAEVVLDERPSVTFRAGPATHVDIALDGDGKKATLTARDFFGNLAGEYRTTVIETNASEH